MQPVRAPTPIIEISPPHKTPPLETPEKNFSWWEFRPPKKYLAPSSPIPRRHPHGPPPPLCGDLLGFSIHSRTPPPSLLLAPRAPPSLPPSRKKKNTRNIHQVFKQLNIGAALALSTAFPERDTEQIRKQPGNAPRANSEFPSFVRLEILID